MKIWPFGPLAICICNFFNTRALPFLSAHGPYISYALPSATDPNCNSTRPLPILPYTILLRALTKTPYYLHVRPTCSLHQLLLDLNSPTPYPYATSPTLKRRFPLPAISTQHQLIHHRSPYSVFITTHAYLRPCAYAICVSSLPNRALYSPLPTLQLSHCKRSSLHNHSFYA